jgi:ApbE superfamily uncharacterized protein (UPF0280 family)
MPGIDAPDKPRARRMGSASDRFHVAGKQAASVVQQRVKSVGPRGEVVAIRENGGNRALRTYSYW